MTPQRFHTLIAELVDENPFAIRAVLKILEVEFTERVPTMAVTREHRPRLLVNLGFVQEHCATDDHVKAVICHEFLHIILGHTEDKRALTPARHLAFDAVINAIIHRTFGPSFSSMMSEYYAGTDDIRRIRTANRVSQAVFAAFLGIGKTTVQQWEQGQKKPSGPALRLLDLIDRKGLAALG